MVKPPHLLVHPSKPGNPPTLLDGLRDYFAFEIANGGQLAIVTRLDRETSGLVLVSKTREAAGRLGRAMEAREFRKTYHALVHGWPEEDRFTVDAPLRARREVEPTPIHVMQTVHPGGKASRTGFAVERRFRAPTSNGNRFSLLRCEPLTGRMHQIRVHLSHAGFPIVGDKIYGPGEQCYLDFVEKGWTRALSRTLLLDRQALHASRLGWGEREWSCGLPEDMIRFLEKSGEGNNPEGSPGKLSDEIPGGLH